MTCSFLSHAYPFFAYNGTTIFYGCLYILMDFIKIVNISKFVIHPYTSISAITLSLPTGFPVFTFHRTSATLTSKAWNIIFLYYLSWRLCVFELSLVCLNYVLVCLLFCGSMPILKLRCDRLLKKVEILQNSLPLLSIINTNLPCIAQGSAHELWPINVIEGYVFQ